MAASLGWARGLNANLDGDISEISSSALVAPCFLRSSSDASNLVLSTRSHLRRPAMVNLPSFS